MSSDQIVVETLVSAPAGKVWDAYTFPAHIVGWNFASDEWHCPSAEVDLREGGAFRSRMEAKDGSMGFDFVGTYTKIVDHQRIEYAFGDRRAIVEFHPDGDQTRVRVSFDPDGEFPVEQQRSGWQSILNNFARYVTAGASTR